MADNRSVWGIDIGQSALKALKLTEVSGQVVAAAFDYVPYPKILSQPDAIPEELIPEALNTFLSRNNVKDDLLAISVPGQTALARFIQLPPVEISKLAEIVKYEARQQIPFALEDVIWDYQPLGAGNEESGYLLDAEVGLFAMKRDQVMQHLRPFNNAKLEIELIQIAPLALSNVLAYDELGIRPDSASQSADEFAIMLDMGCDNTTLMVSNGAKIWIRNVPIGGNHFTRALTKEMKLSFAKAEHLKCNATKSPDPRAVFQALRPVFNDYVSEIQRSIGYFSSVNRAAKISKVIGVGNGFKLAGLQKFLQQNLQYEVERPDTFKALAGDSVISSPLFADNLLSFAVPYGLALQTLGLTRIHTTLLPPEITTARKIRRKKPWAVATAAALLMGFSLATIGNGISYGVVHTEDFKQAEEQSKSMVAEVGGLKTAYEGEQTAFTATQERLDKLVTARRDIPWLEVYDAVIDCLPRDPEGAEIADLTKRNMISLKSITAEKKADISEWFGKIPPAQLAFLTKQEQEAAPSGEGYIFTLTGQHWHDGGSPSDRGHAFIYNTLIENLQQARIERNGYFRDVGRLGISHPLITWYETRQIIHTQPVRPRDTTSRLDPLAATGGAAPGDLAGAGSLPGESYDPGQLSPESSFLNEPMGQVGPQGTLDENSQRITETNFTVQFVLKLIPLKDRAALSEEAAAPSDAVSPDDTPAPEGAVTPPPSPAAPEVVTPAAAPAPAGADPANPATSTPAPSSPAASPPAVNQ